MQAPVSLPATPAWVREFKEFISRGNVIDLAVGIIIGAAFTAIVQSMVKDIFTPIIGMIVGGVDFSGLAVTVGQAKIQYGLFLNACFSFLVVSFAIFWLVKVLARMRAKQEAAPEPAAPPPPTRSEELLGEIRDILREKRA